VIIVVKGYFNLQKLMDGKERVEAEKPAATLREIWEDLCRRFGREFIETVCDAETKEPAAHIMLLVNGRNYLSMPDKLDTALRDGDEIALFPPLAGG
jgi:MoaD family protein